MNFQSTYKTTTEQEEIKNLVNQSISGDVAILIKPENCMYDENKVDEYASKVISALKEKNISIDSVNRYEGIIENKKCYYQILFTRKKKNG